MEKQRQPHLFEAGSSQSGRRLGTSRSGIRSGSRSAARSQWRIYDELRERIINMDIPPDTPLSRVDLAQDFEVSQTPVREALQLLEQDGLVRIQPQSKTVVTRLDTVQLHEAHFLRVALEAEVVRRLAEQVETALADTVSRLKSIIKLQSALAGNIEEMVMFNELDEAFHRTLFEAVDQPGLYELARSRSGHMARARRLDLPVKGKMLEIVAAHKKILDAIEQGDPQAADKALRAHLSGTVARISKLQEEYPDYFSD